MELTCGLPEFLKQAQRNSTVSIEGPGGPRSPFLVGEPAVGEDWASLPLPAGLVTLLAVFFGGMMCLVSREERRKKRRTGLDGRQRKVRNSWSGEEVRDEKG